MKRFIYFAFLIAVSVSAHSDPRIISVEGKGRFEYPAEMIRIDFSVFNQSDRDIKDAKAKVDRASTALVRSLVKLGINEKDILSPSFSIESDDGYDQDDCPIEPMPIVGRNMEVLVRDIKLYRKVIDALVENGVTSIGTIESEVADLEKYKRSAMLAAIDDAKKQAAFLVENLGGTLGKVHSIGEKRTHNFSKIEEIVVSGIRASDRDEIPYDFQPKPVEVLASIYVEFEIE